jgi:hypothetical protein
MQFAFIHGELNDGVSQSRASDIQRLQEVSF